jgi:hypothetical protein
MKSRFIVPIYDFAVTVVQVPVSKINAVRAGMNDLLGEPDSHISYANAAFCLSERECVLFFTNEAACDVGAVGHEIVHLVAAIMRSSGVAYSFKSEEAFAYLHGWLERRIWTILHKFSERKTPKKVTARRKAKS